jgi:histidinol dehydrogenase
VHVRDLSEGIELANLIAPEHLELHVDNAMGLIAQDKNAGCVLLGKNAPAAASDYIAGPSHCLPTGRSARFSSGLGVMDFMKRSDVVWVSASCLEGWAQSIRQFTAMEGLEGHNRAVEIRRLRRVAARRLR